MEKSEIPFDTRLSYRVGVPILPVLPVETTRIPDPEQILPNWSHLSSAFARVLLKNDIKSVDMRMAYRHHRGATPNADSATFLVVTDIRTPEDIKRCKSAAQEIWVVLKEAKAEGSLHVEIIDYQANRGLLTAPILAEESDVSSQWATFRDVVRRTIDHKNWLSVDLLHRKLHIDAEGSFVTVVITATDADDTDWWDEVLPQLKSQLPSTFSVELGYQQSLWTTQEESRRNCAITMDAYEEYVQIGASIGLCGSPWTGTLGAPLEIVKNGERIEVALTNHHVVFHPELFKDARSPLRPEHTPVTSRQYTMMCPSDRDHNDFERATSKFDIPRLETAIQDTTMIEKAQYDPRAARLLTKYLAEKERHEKNLQDIKITARDLGHVWASSGLRRVEAAELSGSNKEHKWGLDWALIKLDSDRSVLERIPRTTGYVSLPDTGKCVEWRAIDKYSNYSVAKCGRTSGWSVGEITTMETMLNWNPKPRDGKCNIQDAEMPYFGKPNTILAHAIVGDQRRATEFLAAGDSGSVVFHNKPNDRGTAVIVGLGFATNDFARVSYMMPMSTVIEDIEEVCQGKVVSPTQVANDD